MSNSNSGSNSKSSNNCLEPVCWIGVDLPFRPTTGTYGTFSARTLPPVTPEANPFHHIKGLKGLAGLGASDLPADSPTACYYDIDPETGVFYCDQQGCVIWALDELTGGVYLWDPERDDSSGSEDNDAQARSNKKTYVARSLGEFLYRIDCENRLWSLCSREWDKKKQYARLSSYIETGEWEEDSLCGSLATYLGHYRQLYLNTRAAIQREYGGSAEHIDKWLLYFFKPNEVDPETLHKNHRVPPETWLIQALTKLAEQDKLKIKHSFMDLPSLDKDTILGIKALNPEN